MPKQNRIKTNYQGVYYIDGISNVNNKAERIYYIFYRKNGKQIEEKVGRQFKDDMTPAKASRLRALRIEGKQLSNEDCRNKEKEIHLAKNIWTINRLWNEFHYQKSEEGLKSLRDDIIRYNKHIADVFGEKEPKDLTVTEIDSFRIELLKHLKPATAKQVLILLQRIINFGFHKQLIPPLTFKIQMPKVYNLKTEDLTPEMIKKLLKAIDEDDDIQTANFVKIALYTGMRRSEIFRLQWEDIDYQHGFIYLRDSKGGPDQKIPLNNAARSVFKCQPKTDSSYVFPGRYGGQLTDNSISINRIKKRAGLPKDFRPLHGLRHAYASMLASSGKVDMYTLQKLLTHKSPQMTQRYAHLRDETLKKAAELAGEIIEEAGRRNDSSG